MTEEFSTRIPERIFTIMHDQYPLQKLHYLQKKEGWTNHEMALMLGISEKAWEHWLNGRRKPRGGSLALVVYILDALNGKPVTRERLLAKTGRIGCITSETLKDIEMYG